MNSRGAVRPWSVGLLWLERALIVSGLALLLSAVGVRLVGEYQKRQGLKRFAAALRSVPRAAPVLALPAPPPVGAENPVDTSLWAEGRVRLFEESLRKDFGAPLAVLSIPKIGLEVPVLEGTDDVTLNRAVGLIEGTQRPDEGGNCAIAGHRDGFFRGLKDVHVGDVLQVRTLSARYEYVVESTRIIPPDEVRVLDETPSPVLTLVTCYPFYFVGHAPQRYIVRATRRSNPVPGS